MKVAAGMAVAVGMKVAAGMGVAVGMGNGIGMTSDPDDDRALERAAQSARRSGERSTAETISRSTACRASSADSWAGRCASLSAMCSPSSRPGPTNVCSLHEKGLNSVRSGAPCAFAMSSKVLLWRLRSLRRRTAALRGARGTVPFFCSRRSRAASCLCASSWRTSLWNLHRVRDHGGARLLARSLARTQATR